MGHLGEVSFRIKRDPEVHSWILIEDNEAGRLAFLKIPQQEVSAGVESKHALLRRNLANCHQLEASVLDQNIHRAFLNLIIRIDQLDVSNEDGGGVNLLSPTKVPNETQHYHGQGEEPRPSPQASKGLGYSHIESRTFTPSCRRLPNLLSLSCFILCCSVL
jgi:hypothetical protein